MGEVDRITNVGNSGLHLFNAYQNKNVGHFIEDTIEEDVAKGNIKLLRTDYSKWISTTEIQQFFDKYCQNNRTLDINASNLNN